jgi:hypothetical protein
MGLMVKSQDERAAKLAASGLLQAVDLGAGPHARPGRWPAS